MTKELHKYDHYAHIPPTSNFGLFVCLFSYCVVLLLLSLGGVGLGFLGFLLDIFLVVAVFGFFRL